jgi:hypothetical protein
LALLCATTASAHVLHDHAAVLAHPLRGRVAGREDVSDSPQDLTPIPSPSTPPVVAPRRASRTNATPSDIAAARKIVKDAINAMRKLNKQRLDHPAHNLYQLRPGTRVGKRESSDQAGAPSPLLNITADIAWAAALLADIDGANATTSSPPTVQKRAGAFWMEGIARKGTVPWGNDASYKVRTWALVTFPIGLNAADCGCSILPRCFAML